jgi:apolipoprotein N-acyltransferase
VRVAAVQGDVPTAGLEFNAQRRAVLDYHVRGTLALADAVRAGRSPAPDLVVWPENSSDIDPLLNPDASAEIGQAADAVGVPLLVGAVLQGPGDDVSNAAIVWGSSSASPGPGARYVKRHPVPFAEYIPYRSFFRVFSDKVDLVTKDFAAGDRAGVLQLGPARIGDVICFEVAYDDIVRDVVTGGADLLVVQTNNATFGYTDESVQQLAMSRLRAVEAGRAVVHVSTVGVSGLVEPDGRVVAGSRLFTPAVLQAGLPLRTGFTVATRLGVLPEAVLALTGVLLVGLAVVRDRRRRRPNTPEAVQARLGEPAVTGGAS